MSLTHLKIGADARIVMRESRWRELLARTTGHITIGARVRLRVVPDDTPIDRTEILRDEDDAGLRRS